MAKVTRQELVDKLVTNLVQIIDHNNHNPELQLDAINTLIKFLEM